MPKRVFLTLTLGLAVSSLVLCLRLESEHIETVGEQIGAVLLSPIGFLITLVFDEAQFHKMEPVSWQALGSFCLGALSLFLALLSPLLYRAKKP